jgi:hypothetical protein
MDGVYWYWQIDVIGLKILRFPFMQLSCMISPCGGDMLRAISGAGEIVWT